MAHQLRVAAVAVFLVTVTLVLGVLGIDLGIEAAVSGFTRTDAGGGVTVNVTYVHPQAADEIRFEVVLDTHTLNLDTYDLKTLSALRDGTGNNYRPIKVDNKGSGHHREITLVFAKASPSAKRLELVIKDIGRVKERFFFWDLQ